MREVAIQPLLLISGEAEVRIRFEEGHRGFHGSLIAVT
jgi:hypothetical protein